jgi:pimeloyl-ACP methyl ester carboxylesterase
VSRCAAIKALALYGADGLDFSAGMDPEGARTFAAIGRGDRAALEADAADTMAWVEGDLPGLDCAAPVAAMLEEAFREAFRQGPAGHMDDVAAHVRPLGYELEAITTPTLLLAGREDTAVPPGHGHWFASRIPGARLTWMDGGHMDTDEQEELRAFVWTTRGAPTD